MKSAYNEIELRNLHVVKEARRWLKHGVMDSSHFVNVATAHPVTVYHPNIIIRVLLFIATIIALGGVTGMLGLMVAAASENSFSVLCFVYGFVSFIVLEKAFIKNAQHYKSGVTEAILYHALGFTIGGFGWMIQMEEVFFLFFCVAVFSFAAYRYLDLVSTVCAVGSMAGLTFYILFESGETVQQFIPIVFIALFTPLYFFIKKVKTNASWELWANVLVVAEALSLLLIYLAGNYLVVRELSVELLSMPLEEGQDIPLALIFYALTILIPAAYLYFGIRKKDLVLIRTSLFVFAFSVFTFKYYYSTGHHEITFTLGGAFLLIVSIALLHFLKVPRNGYTRENLLPEKWGNENLQAFIVSQTLGGNSGTENATVTGGGGESAGGGSSDSF